MQRTYDMRKYEEFGKKDYPVIPADKYQVIISHIKDKKTKNGDDMVSVGFTITHGQYQGQMIWSNITMCESIMGMVKHFLHCIGEPYDGEKIIINSERWEGKELEIVTKLGEYNGSPKSEVAEYILKEEISINEPDDIPF